MKSNPVVSIIMPAHNSEHYIAAAIESVLAQTYTDWKLIVTDDHSTDLTADLVQDYADRNERINLFYTNYYYTLLPAPRSTGVSLAIMGRFIVFLDSDDIWLPNKIEEQIIFFEKFVVAIVYSNYEMLMIMCIVVNGFSDPYNSLKWVRTWKRQGRRISRE
jgi:glycosyltransferase involved in cell wall biosynthesis